ncbi:uncharacterized protein V1510DRAFT_436345 [Dipodascopsis tothii]|uniref:uncharacterized protein n=1 Tax=Dipodascopsis tothii TaxID=44089 RepID=UPI0034CE555F
MSSPASPRSRALETAYVVHVQSGSRIQGALASAPLFVAVAELDGKSQVPDFARAMRTLAQTHHVLLSPSRARRPFVVVEPTYLPVTHKRALVDAVFDTFQTACEVAFVPAPVCAALAAATENALVIELDAGTTTVTPVCAFYELPFVARTSTRAVEDVALARTPAELDEIYFARADDHDDDGELPLDELAARVLFALPIDVRAAAAAHVVFAGPAAGIAGLRALALARIRTAVAARQPFHRAVEGGNAVLAVRGVATLGAVAGAALYLGRADAGAASLAGCFTGRGAVVDRAGWEASGRRTVPDWACPA